MTIGERIKKIRQENGLSQRELGKKLNVSQQMIGQWETGKSNPKIETLRRIADTLEVGLWEIVELDQMDLDTLKQEIPKILSLYTLEDLKEFDRLATEALNENQESIQKERKTEACELFHSLLSEEWVMSQEQETTAVQLKEMLRAYSRLNNAGRKEAVKRINELTEIPRYTKPPEHP